MVVRSLLNPLVGPIVYRKEITELSGSFLADYETETIMVPLTDDERQQYDAHRKAYTHFIERKRSPCTVEAGLILLR